MKKSFMKQLRNLLLCGAVMAMVFCPAFSMNASAKAPTAEAIMNSAVLTPSYSKSTYFNQYLDQLMPQLITPQMSNYQKAKVCYDYIINTTSYGMIVPDPAASMLFNSMDEYFAYCLLVNHVGVCDDYSEAYATMLRYIGFNARTQGGQTSKASGGYTGHTWVVVDINGTEYVFDPQVEDNIAKGGPIKDFRFCKTYDQVPGKYIISNEPEDAALTDELFGSMLYSMFGGGNPFAGATGSGSSSGVTENGMSYVTTVEPDGSISIVFMRTK